jgi:hypothetical protein
MMTNFDIMCFLEFYANRANVMQNGLRTPTRRFQNFYQIAQELSIDTEVSGIYPYLAFDVDGFGSAEAGAVNDLSISLAALGDLVDLTDAAMRQDTLVVASLVIQSPGQDQLDSASAQIISRYVGGIDAASIDDTTIQWTVNPLLNKTKAQIPTKKVSSSILARRQGQ